MERNAVLVLLNNSLGEIHFILPYLKRLKTTSAVDIYFHFINAKIYNKAIDEPFYYDQIVALAVILKPNDLLKFLLANRKRVGLILKDTTPLAEKNIVFKVKTVCPKAKLVLFPHAYALLGYQDAPIAKGKTLSIEDKHVDRVLYVHAFDAPVLAQRYDPAKLLFAGALGYTPWWSAEVKRYTTDHHQKLKLNIPANRSVVLFTLRDVHRQYLDETNFDYLFKTSLEILFKTTNYFIIIKPHPRQNLERLKQYLAVHDEDRYVVSYHNTFVLSHFSDLNLSFWSSAVTDSLAMGIPSIEYHRFHVPFGQTVDVNGELRSFYSHLGLTKAVTSAEGLQNVLPTSEATRAELYKDQKKALEKVFTGTEEGFNNFAALAEQGKIRSDFSDTNKALALVYFIAKYIFRKLKPI